MRLGCGEPAAELVCACARGNLNFRACRILHTISRGGADESWSSGNDIRIEFSLLRANCAKSGGFCWLNAQP
jgi:hypothetical protein